MSTSVKICKTSDIKPGRGYSVYIGKKRVAAYCVNDEYFVLDDECLHRGAPLSEGVQDGHSVTCPLHDWTYHLRTGALLDREGTALTIYSVTIKNDEIWIDWPHDTL